MSFIYMALAARQILCPKSWPSVAVGRMIESRQQISVKTTGARKDNEHGPDDAAGKDEVIRKAIRS
jgi:hypothetical protein